MKLVALAAISGLMTVWLAAPARAADVPGFEFLLLREDARTMGMGDAYTALSDGPGALYGNPAGAAFSDKTYLSFGLNGYTGLQNNGGGSANGGGLSEGSFLWRDLDHQDALGFSLATYGLSSQGYDVNDNPVGGSVGESDFAGALTYAQRFGDNLSVGVEGQYASQQLNSGQVNGLPEYKYSAVLGTFGLQYRSDSQRLSLGLEAYNEGLGKTAAKAGGVLPAPTDTQAAGALSYPSGIRFGAAYKLFEDRSLLLAADYDAPAYTTADSFNMGLEYLFGGHLFLRGGFSVGNEQTTPSFGIGLLWDRFLFDAAFNDRSGALGLGPQLALNLSWAFDAHGAAKPRVVAATPPSPPPPHRHLPVVVETPTVAGKIYLNGTKYSIAVARFTAESVDEPSANFVAQRLRTAIVNSGIFVVVDRANMDKILAEQKFQQTGCTKQDCAVQMGKILNVSKMIAGTVSKLQDIYYIHADVIDVQTGKIEAAGDDKAGSFDDVADASDRLANRLLSNYVP